MRVQYRLLAASLLLVLVFLAGIFILQRNQQAQLALVAAGRQQELEGLFQKILALEEKEMETLAFDYTYWDELVDFIRTRDMQWGRNILDSSLDNYEINAIWVYNTDMELVYETTNLPGGIAPPIPLSDSALKSLFSNNFMSRFAFRAPDGNIIEVRGATVHPSEDVAHATPALGYFFVGRAWLPERINYVSQITGAQVSITANRQVNRDEFSANTLWVYYPLDDAAGNPIAYVRGVFNSSFITGFMQAQQHDLRIFMAFTGLVLLLLFSGFILWIAIPLRNISLSLATGDPAPIRPLQRDRGEFGRIANLIIESFSHKQAMAERIEQQQIAETALRDSERRFRILSEISSDITYILKLDAQGKASIEWGADLITRSTGHPIKNTADLSALLETVHPEDRGEIQTWVERLMAGHAIEAEIRMLNHDGALRWFQVRMTPTWEGPEGRSLHVYGSALDITIQRAVEEAYRSLVDQSPQGLSIVQNNRIVFANPAIAEMVGNTREELLALSPEEISTRIHPEDLAANADKMAAVLRGESDQAVYPIRVRHTDGRWRWLEVRGELTEYQGLPALQVSFVDVTGRREAEAALAEQLEYSSLLFNTVSSLILVLDPQGHITTLNPAAVEFFGGKHAVENRLLWEVFHLPEDSPLAGGNFAGTLAGQQPADNLDLVFLQTDRRRWLTWSHRYLLDRDGQVIAVIGTANDITERRMRERQREAVAGIAAALRGTTTRKETIRIILATIRDYLDAHTVSIVFPVPETDDLLMEEVIGDLASEIAGSRLPADNSIAGEVMRSGKPCYCNDPSLEPRYSLKQVADRSGPTAWAPLISEDKPIGLLIISRAAPIGPEDLDHFQPVADMAAGAIDRVTRSEQAQRRIQQLSALQSINLAIGASLDLHLTLNVLTVQMTTQLGVDAVVVYLRNPHTKLLRAVAHNGFHSHVMESFQLWEGEGQAGRVAIERRSRHLYDPEGIGSYFFPADLFGAEGFVAYDAVPLVVKGEVKGVIEAFHRPPYNATGEWLQLLEALALETAIAIDNAEMLEKLQRSNQDLKLAYDTTIEGWARSLEQFGIEWGKHSRRVVDLTTKLAQWMGISGTALTNIRYGALLHDIGKIGVPRNILEKPDKLTAEEWEIVKQHPRYAFEILHDIPFLRPALDIPYRHHERWNGSGYPDGLKGEEIPLAARIFAVVDIFDALTSHRPYSSIWSEEDALEYLSDTAGREVDPKVARAFLDMYPLLGRNRPA